MDFDKITDIAHSFFNTTENVGNIWYILKRTHGESPELIKLMELLKKCESLFDDVLVEVGIKYRK